jgi:hypothetical protein
VEQQRVQQRVELSKVQLGGLQVGQQEKPYQLLQLRSEAYPSQA